MDTSLIRVDTTYLPIDSTQHLIQVTKIIEVETNCEIGVSSILLIISICGIIGGFVTFLLDKNSPQRKYVQPSLNNDHLEPESKTAIETNSESIGLANYLALNIDRFILHILMGIIGASLIPLFLYITSSEVLSSSKNGYQPELLLIAYCFLGAIFSRSLLNSMARRLDLEELKQRTNNAIEEAKEAKEQAHSAKKNTLSSSVEIESIKETTANVEHIVKEKFHQEKLLEENGDDNADKERIFEIIREFLSVNGSPTIKAELLIPNVVTESHINIRKVWRELRNPKYTDRSIAGLAKRTKLNPEEVKEKLDIFVNLGYAQEVKWYGNTFYRLTEKGVLIGNELPGYEK